MSGIITPARRAPKKYLDARKTEQNGKAIPEEGAWIIVVEEPYTELRSRFRIPELSMWRARPHELNSGALTIGSGREAVKVHPKQAIIATPGGDLHL